MRYGSINSLRSAVLLLRSRLDRLHAEAKSMTASPRGWAAWHESLIDEAKRSLAKQEMRLRREERAHAQQQAVSSW